MKILKNIFITTLLVFLITDISISQTSFPIKISSNKRFLVDKNNTPFPILGRTSWCILSQPVNQYKKYIAHTKSLGFNSIELAVIFHWRDGNHAPYNGNGDLPFVKRLDDSLWSGSLVYNNNKQAPDLITPDEKYWKFVDSFVSYCATQHILIFLFPAYVGYNGGDQGWMQELIANGPQKVESYGRWIANRYKKSTNIVWMLLGDMGVFKEEEKIAEAALIKGLKSVAGQQSTQYTAEPNSGQNSADQIDFGDQMTLNAVYTWDSINVASHARLGYLHEPVMPSFLLEEPYDEEGLDGNNYNPHATQPVRRFQWWAWLNTTGGYIAGNGYIWPFIDPTWQKHLNTQGALDMGRLNNFIKSIHWWQLVPSGLNGMKNLVIIGGNIDTLNDYVAAAATRDGTLLIAYIPPAHVGNITIDMTALSGPAFASWYDPTNGTYKKTQDAPFDNKGNYTFHVPDNNSRGEKDWVLVIKR